MREKMRKIQRKVPAFAFAGMTLLMAVVILCGLPPGMEQSGLPPGMEQSGLPPGATIDVTIGPPGAFAQVDLYQYNMGEILNAWNQRVDTLLFNDTIAAGDTVESAPIGLIGIYTGRPQYWCAALEVDTLRGNPSPGLLIEFRMKVRDTWFSPSDGSEKFIANAMVHPYPWRLIYPLLVCGGDSIKYLCMAEDSCILRLVHWQIH